MPHTCRILQKCTIFGESDTHPLTFLKSPSNIAFNPPGALLRPMHYPGKAISRSYLMASLPVKFGFCFYQVCRDKLQIWEDVPQLNGVTKPEQERYSVAMFFDPSLDCVVECLKSCCSESSPPS
ncbi:hypothetical protein MTR67_036938 [Solanum verrucosum]|uniref:Uncharacterized protein n=1 Tax=Solanum verrucosum TaxID=315347 RepID=A0AAF0UCN2_SOLVR|nr:hypothetical protein MTR67_036938 [Solanum verrucosum]